MELQDLKDLIKNFEDGSIRDLIIDDGDFHLKLSKNENAQTNTTNIPKVTSVVSDAEPKALNPEKFTTGANDEKQDIIKAPLVGSIYLQANEGSKPYVNVGDNIKKGQTVAIIEAMKMMTEIKSKVSGKITEILVENEEIVEFDTPLFKIIAD